MNSVTKLFTAVLFMLAVACISSCKKTFDQPPGPVDPTIVANMTIAQFKALHTVLGKLDMITDDIIISGVVTADDKSGNLYKQLFIADSSGALQILLDVPSLYGTYPVGRKLFIKCKDLCLTDYNRTMQLGVRAYVSGIPTSQAIPANLIGNYVIGGSLNNPVIPTVVTLAQLGGSSVDMNNKYVGALIQLNDYEFANPLNTFADTSAYRKDTNDTLQNCSGSKVILRSSGYAKFAGLRVPSGNGSIVAIYTVFQSSGTGTKQLVLRDTGDIKFTNGRCGAPPPGSTVYIDENFETQSYTVSTPQTYSPIAVAGWQNLAEVGGRTYSARFFSSSKYAYLSGFGSGGVTTSWLVTKAINRTTANTTLTFDTKQDFLLTVAPGGTPVPAALKILISTDYTGTGNPWAAGVNWTDITAQATLSPGSTTGNFPSDYTPSGNISINGTGNVYVAFKYEGDDPAGTASDKTSAWEIDNIRVLGN